MKKHHFLLVTKYNKKYFGRHGFKRHNYIVKNPKTINLMTLQNVIPTLIKEGKAKTKGDSIYIDLDKSGYEKLLSKGTIDKKIHVKIKSASPGAIKKIENANGQVKLLS